MNRDEILRIANELSGDDVCAELLALSVVEHSYTPGTRITLEVGNGSGRLTDTGRGMRLSPDRGDTIGHAERALTGFYPCLPSNPLVETALRELVWGERGSLGPALANFACRSYRFESMRDGEAWSQSYREGVPTGPAVRVGPAGATGTRVDFETSRAIDYEKVARLVDAMRARIQGISITLAAIGQHS
jgi:DNA gyrase/topoisomerase IV subunit B